MSLPRVPNTLGTISKLDDRPNDTGGLTAAELKAKFDKDSETLKTFLNNALIPYLESASAAAQLGIQTIPGFSAADIQTALEEIVKAMQDVTQGAVPNKSITLLKLAEDVTAAALGGAAASHTHGAADVSSGVLDVERIPALTGDKLPDGIITEGKLGAASVTSAKLAALSVLAAHIARGAVTGQKIADKTITAANMADDAVKLTFSNTSVPVASFVSDTTYPDFPYRAAAALSGVTEAMVPEVVFSAADAMSGSFAPVAAAYDGGIYIYASEVPAAAVTIPTILCWR